MISETKIHLSQAMTPVQAKAKGFNLSAILTPLICGHG
jgi:hypothetical protein